MATYGAGIEIYSTVILFSFINVISTSQMF